MAYKEHVHMGIPRENTHRMFASYEAGEVLLPVPIIRYAFEQQMVRDWLLKGHLKCMGAI